MSDVFLIRSCISLLKSHEIFLLWFFRSTQNDIFSRLSFLVENSDYCGAPIKETGRHAKHAILCRGLNYILECATLHSKPEVWRVFCPLRCFKVRAEPNWMVEGPWQFSLSGPHDEFPDVIVCKNYVFADSQRSRLLFVVVENVLTQLHIQFAARRYFLIQELDQGSQTQIALWATWGLTR